MHRYEHVASSLQKIDYQIDYGLHMLAPVTSADSVRATGSSTHDELKCMWCSVISTHRNMPPFCIFFPSKRLGFVRYCKR